MKEMTEMIDEVVNFPAGEMVIDYDTQLKIMEMATKAIADATAALKVAKNKIEIVRKQFPGRAKDANKIMKALDSSDGKIWDAAVLASALSSDIRLCKEQEEGEPDLPGMGGMR